MYLQEVYTVFKKSGELVIVKDGLLVGLYEYVAENMIEQEIKKGLIPNLTMDDVEIKPIYLLREGEKK